jgi:hypothetical protein
MSKTSSKKGARVTSIYMACTKEIISGGLVQGSAIF